MGRRLPRVVLAGRVNVGKSSLFNALIGHRRALEDAWEGVTRDGLEEKVEWGGKEFLLCDSAGALLDWRELKATPEKAILRQVRQRNEELYAEASLLLFVLDARTGLLPEEMEIGRMLRRFGKPLLYVLNKCDTAHLESATAEFYALGADQFFTVSAKAKRGLGDLLDAILEKLPQEIDVGEDSESDPLSIVLLGRPNVGKSTLFNRLVGQERAIVSEVAGTTRDSLKTPFSFEGKDFLLIDTAGLRQKKQIQTQLDYAAVKRSLRAARRESILLLLLDATTGIKKQDKKIGEWIEEAGKPCLLVVNKWDCVEQKREVRRQWKEKRVDALPELKFAPLLPLSALHGTGLKALFQMIEKVAAEYRKRVPTAELNRMLAQVFEQHSPPYPVKLRYITQVSTAPPKFVCLGKRVEKCRQTFRKYLLRQLREQYGFIGCPIRLELRNEKGGRIPRQRKKA